MKSSEIIQVGHVLIGDFFRFPLNEREKIEDEDKCVIDVLTSCFSPKVKHISENIHSIS